MTTLREAAEKALEALEDMLGWESLAPQSVQASSKQSLQRLREALSQPEPKPLTDEEITALVLEWWCPTMVTAKDRKFVRAIERAHGIGEKE